jgi:hypothetical protein
MNESLNNLFLALQQIEVTPDPVPEYRFYYDDTGRITNCSMFNHPESGRYLVVTREEYDNYTRYEIKNDKLSLIKTPNQILSALVKSHTGFATVKGHAALLVEDTEVYTDIEYYAPRSD